MESVPPMPYADLVTLVRWMVEQGFTADELADAVEKPYGRLDWIELAKRGESLPDDQ